MRVLRVCVCASVLHTYRRYVCQYECCRCQRRFVLKQTLGRTVFCYFSFTFYFIIYKLKLLVSPVSAVVCECVNVNNSYSVSSVWSQVVVVVVVFLNFDDADFDL